MMMGFIFFFKQKTAYEMRISDWSSDVCSSDLATITVFTLRGFAAYSQAVLMSHVGHRVVAKIQQQLFDKLIGADLAFFHHSSPGTLISHFINAVALLRHMASKDRKSVG